MEQISTPSMSEKEQSKRQMEHDRRISSRQQNRHVHGELARIASYELSQKEKTPMA